MMQFSSIPDRRFRTSSFFSLKEWKELSHHDRQLLQELSGSEEVYGIFQPAFAAPHLTAKLAYAETALLYFHFQKPGTLPCCFANRPEENVTKTLAHLVLDRILEVEWKGAFVSGSDAVEAIYEPAALAQNGAPSFLSSLSMKAISHAFLLRHRDVKALAQWLYTFNTWPWDAAAKKRFTDAQPMYGFLFSKSGNNTKKQLKQEWRFVSPQQNFAWFSWVRDGRHLTGNGPTFKLYISPVPAHLPEVFATLSRRINASAAFCFKACATVQGILRPDKLVVYFDSREALFQTAAVLTEELKAYKAQGVPFTSQLDQQGMLSWGVDPPADELLQTVEEGSWRTTVTEQLAVAILGAKEDMLNGQPALSFVKAKLYAAGINLNNWTAVEDGN